MAVDPQVNPAALAVSVSRELREFRLDRWVWGIAAGLVIAAFGLSMLVFWVPAHPGTDQNGYLVGGKLLAKTFSTGFRPANEFSFVGRMWVQVADGRCFPKYPIGLSVLDAIALKFGGPRHGVAAAFAINPVAMTVALIAIFLTARLFVGSFWGLLSTLLVATSPVCIGLTDNPNSHATALFCASWGMYLLLRWWQRDGLWRAILSGLLLGSAVTIRYTEGMLILPIVIVAAFHFRRQRSTLIETALVFVSWGVPVLLLAAYNWHSMHHLTGYDPTNESTGFSLDKFGENWETMLRELYNTGFFFTLPFTLIGAVLMFQWNWRLSLVLAAWAVPNLLLYSAYYWAPDGSTISYLRFTLTIFPALAIATVWGLRSITKTASPTLSMAVAGVIVAGGCAVNLYTALDSVSTEAIGNRALLDASRHVLAHAPAGSMLLDAVGGERLCDYLQLVGDYDLYDLQQFDRSTLKRFINDDPAAPTLLQPQRAKLVYDRFVKMNDKELTAEQDKLIDAEFAQGKRVFIVLVKKEPSTINRYIDRRAYVTKPIDSWDEQTDFKFGKKQRWLGFNAGKVAEPTKAVQYQLLEVVPAPPPPVKIALAKTGEGSHDEARQSCDDATNGETMNSF